MNIYVCVYIYVYNVYKYTCRYSYIHIHMHTHTHTHNHISYSTQAENWFTIGLSFIDRQVILFLQLIFIRVKLIYNVMLVSAVHQSESVIRIHIFTLFQILFPYRSLHSNQQSSLCYTVGSYWLPILYIVVCICQSQSPNLSLLPSLPPW